MESVYSPCEFSHTLPLDKWGEYGMIIVGFLSREKSKPRLGGGQMKGAQGRLFTRTTYLDTSEWQGREMQAVYFHDTPVVSWDDRYIVLRTGGWKTYWTKQKMNQVSRDFGLDFHVSQVGGCWWVAWRNFIKKWGKTPWEIVLPRIGGVEFYLTEEAENLGQV